MSSVALLNRLLAIHGRSLVLYLSSAAPWVREGQGEAAALLSTMAVEQNEIVDKLGGMIVDAGGRVEPVGFPMEFTGYHDLSLDYLLSKLIELQQRDIDEIQSVVEAAPDGTTTQSVAQDALGSAKGFLESLREVSTGVSL